MSIIEAGALFNEALTLLHAAAFSLKNCSLYSLRALTKVHEAMPGYRAISILYTAWYSLLIAHYWQPHSPHRYLYNTPHAGLCQQHASRAPWRRLMNVFAWLYRAEFIELGILPSFIIYFSACLFTEQTRLPPVSCQQHHNYHISPFRYAECLTELIHFSHYMRTWERYKLPLYQTWGPSASLDRFAFTQQRRLALSSILGSLLPHFERLLKWFHTATGTRHFGQLSIL